MSLKYRSSKEIKCCIRLMISLVLVLFLAAQTAEAADTDAVEPSVDPIRSNDNYSAVVYNNTNGLPGAEANAIVQTPEGFIWIGCYAGLVRYDGDTFERLDSTEGVNSISGLYVDKKGRLWIGTNDNGVAVMENAKDELFGTDRMLDALNADIHAPVDELLRNVRRAVSDYTAGGRAVRRPDDAGSRVFRNGKTVKEREIIWHIY